MQDFNRGRGAFMKDAEVSKLKGGRLIWTFPQTILDKTGKTEAPGHNDVDNKERLKCCVQSKRFAVLHRQWCCLLPRVILFICTHRWNYEASFSKMKNSLPKYFVWFYKLWCKIQKYIEFIKNTQLLCCL